MRSSHEQPENLVAQFALQFRFEPRVMFVMDDCEVPHFALFSEW